jgi:hypothetical protein
MYEYFVSTPIDQQRKYAFDAEHMQNVLQGKVQNRSKYIDSLCGSTDILCLYLCGHLQMANYLFLYNFESQCPLPLCVSYSAVTYIFALLITIFSKNKDVA